MNELSTKRLLEIARDQLAVDLNCAPEDLSRDGFIFREAAELPGRRPFPREATHFEMVTMGRGVVVSATPDLLPRLREKLHGKTRDEAFSMSFVYGQGLYYLPDPDCVPDLSPAAGYTLRVLEREDILALYPGGGISAVPLEGFGYALQGRADHPRPDALAVAAYRDGAIAGIAGCSKDCEMLRQIGIDVLPEHRRAGLAAVLVAALTKEIIRRGKVPYYGVATPNIPSQRVACRCGFFPAWTCVYRGRFDGALTQPSG